MFFQFPTTLSLVSDVLPTSWSSNWDFRSEQLLIFLPFFQTHSYLPRFVQSQDFVLENELLSNSFLTCFVMYFHSQYSSQEELEDFWHRPLSNWLALCDKFQITKTESLALLTNMPEILAIEPGNFYLIITNYPTLIRQRKWRNQPYNHFRMNE